MRLAVPVVAERDHPPYDRVMMDGYAVRVADAGRPVALVGEVAAGAAPSLEIRGDCCAEVMIRSQRVFLGAS
jgi:molybdopterin molybdotransferase